MKCTSVQGPIDCIRVVAGFIEGFVMADKVYDAIVVGSGATGGWAAKELCEAGMEVALLEAGKKLDPATDYSEHARPWDMKYRNKQAEPAIEARRPIGARCYACEETNAHFFVDEVDNPYTVPQGKPFWWIRGRHVGGRTIMWGRQTYRLSDLDFKAASKDGFGEDWPISYAGLAWMEEHCRKQTRKSPADASGDEVAAALAMVSDANESVADALKPGASFFGDLKSRTIFGYYTSREGWVEELGRPEHVGMEKWVGCPHPDGTH